MNTIEHSTSADVSATTATPGTTTDTAPGTTPSTSLTRPPGEVPFFWWELNNEQRFRRTLKLAPLAPISVAAMDLVQGQPVSVLGVTVSTVMMLGILLLYWQRVRDERDEVRARSVLEAPALPADGRFGFIAFGIAPFLSLSAVLWTSTAIDINVPASFVDARDATLTGLALGAPFALIALVLAGLALARRSTRSSRWAATTAIGFVAWFAYAGGSRLSSVDELIVMQAGAVRRGAAELLQPERWEHLATEQRPLATTTLWRSMQHPQALLAARVGTTTAGVNETQCQVYVEAWATTVLRGTGAVSGAVEARAPSPATREQCRIAFRARDPDGSESLRVAGALDCPTTGGSVLYVSTTPDPNDAEDAARALRCKDEP